MMSERATLPDVASDPFGSAVCGCADVRRLEERVKDLERLNRHLHYAAQTFAELAERLNRQVRTVTVDACGCRDQPDAEPPQTWA
jgi:hypothetical protein